MAQKNDTTRGGIVRRTNLSERERAEAEATAYGAACAEAMLEAIAAGETALRAAGAADAMAAVKGDSYRRGKNIPPIAATDRLYLVGDVRRGDPRRVSSARQWKRGETVHGFLGEPKRGMRATEVLGRILCSRAGHWLGMSHWRDWAIHNGKRTDDSVYIEGGGRIPLSTASVTCPRCIAVLTLARRHDLSGVFPETQERNADRVGEERASYGASNAMQLPKVVDHETLLRRLVEYSDLGAAEDYEEACLWFRLRWSIDPEVDGWRVLAEAREAVLDGCEVCGGPLTEAKACDRCLHGPPSVREERAPYGVGPTEDEVMEQWGMAVATLRALLSHGIDDDADPAQVADEFLRSLAGPVAKALSAQPENRPLYRCTACKGTNVQICMWVQPLHPQPQPVDDFGSWNSPDTKWCEDCGEHRLLEEIPEADTVRESRQTYGKSGGCSCTECDAIHAEFIAAFGKRPQMTHEEAQKLRERRESNEASYQRAVRGVREERTPYLHADGSAKPVPGRPAPSPECGTACPGWTVVNSDDIDAIAVVACPRCEKIESDATARLWALQTLSANDADRQKRAEQPPVYGDAELTATGIDATVEPGSASAEALLPLLQEVVWAFEEHSFTGVWWTLRIVEQLLRHAEPQLAQWTPFAHEPEAEVVAKLRTRLRGHLVKLECLRADFTVLDRDLNALFADAE